MWEVTRCCKDPGYTQLYHAQHTPDDSSRSSLLSAAPPEHHLLALRAPRHERWTRSRRRWLDAVMHSPRTQAAGRLIAVGDESSRSMASAWMAAMASMFSSDKAAYWLTVRRRGGPLEASFSRLPHGHFASPEAGQVSRAATGDYRARSTCGLGLGLTSANVVQRIIPGGGA